MGLRCNRVLILLGLGFLAVAGAATELNSASVAELDSIKGIGPATSAKIVDERQRGPFKDWPDFVRRVHGVGEKSAARLSEHGLTVNGTHYSFPAKPASAASSALQP